MVLFRFLIVFLSTFPFVKSEDIGNHRVRRFALSQDSKLAFDFNLLMPVPVLGSMDVLGIVEIPVTVTMTNDSFSWTPISLPYFVMSPPAPIQSPIQSPLQSPLQSPIQSPLPFFTSFNPFDTQSSSYNFNHPNHNYFSVHHIVKRNAASMASRHRIDFLSGIASCLDE